MEPIEGTVVHFTRTEWRDGEFYTEHDLYGDWREPDDEDLYSAPGGNWPHKPCEDGTESATSYEYGEHCRQQYRPSFAFIDYDPNSTLAGNFLKTYGPEVYDQHAARGHFPPRKQQTFDPEERMPFTAPKYDPKPQTWGHDPNLRVSYHGTYFNPSSLFGFMGSNFGSGDTVRVDLPLGRMRPEIGDK